MQGVQLYTLEIFVDVQNSILCTLPQLTFAKQMSGLPAHNPKCGIETLFIRANK